ncbi:MAG: PIN domain-containing protein [Anaerolineae bacterium]|nr:PIN domain-containing protein [Anaerolineae bacterium]
MKYLLGTDIIIYWLNGDHQIEKKALDIGLENIGFSIISKAELFFGAYNSRHVKQNLKNVKRLSNTLSTIQFDDKAAEIFGQLKSNLKKQGNIILDADIMIASIALAHNLTLITNNVSHFKRIPALNSENWRDI